MTKLEQLQDMGYEIDECFCMHEHDNALLGVWFGHSGPCLTYDANIIISNLMESMGISWEGAVEFFSYNIDGCYPGPNAPIYIWN